MPKLQNACYTTQTLLFIDAVSEWAGWTLAHPECEAPVNPTPTKRADYAHRITACPPGFENLTTSLLLVTTIHAISKRL